MYFRRLVAIALALAITLPAAEPPAVERARARLATLRQLFAAGAVSARQVEQAEAAVAQALDDQKIDEAVYGEINAKAFGTMGVRGLDGTPKEPLYSLLQAARKG